MILNYDTIEYKNKFKKIVLLDKGELELPETGICVISGKNGVGKTLLIQNIFYNLQKKNDLNVCFVNQKNGMILKKENVYRNIEMGISEDTDKLEKWMLEKGINISISLNTTKLSGGEQRLIAIARALFSNADVIIMDEPTNDLDYKRVKLLIDVLMKEKDNRLFLIVSHDTRIFKIQDISYELKDSKLTMIRSSMTEKLNKEKSSKSLSNNEVFIRKNFTYNFLGIFSFIIILSFLYVFLSYYIKNVQINKGYNIVDNQIDVFLPTSDGAAPYMLQGAVPISYLKYMKEDMNLLELYDAITNWNEEDRSAITYGLDLEENEVFEVFTMELFDTSSKQAFILLDGYVKSKLMLDTVEFRLNTDELFIYEQDDKCLLEFNKNDFLDYVREESKNDFKIRHQIVVLKKDYNFYDFIQTEEFKELSNGNYYIRSKDTLELYYKVQYYLSFSKIIKLVVASIVILFLMTLFSSFIYIKNNSNTIGVFRDYCITYEKIQSIIIKKNISFYLVMVLIFILAIINGVQIHIFNYIYDYRDLTIFFLVIVIATVLCDTNTRLINYEIKKLYEWRHR